MHSATTDHLANERTFLAWVRTALALIGLGFVLARMGLFLRQLAWTAEQASAPASKALAHGLRAGHEFLASGVVFLVLGTAVCAWSGWVHDRTRRAIDAGCYEPARGSVMGLTLVVVLGGLVLVVMVLGARD